jgi:hypothetical protein
MCVTVMPLATWSYRVVFKQKSLLDPLAVGPELDWEVGVLARRGEVTTAFVLLAACSQFFFLARAAY